MKIFINLIKISLIPLLLSTSCTSRLGKFSIISTENIRGLENKNVNRDEDQTFNAKSCTHRIYVTRVLLGAVTLGIGWFIPELDIVIGESEKERMVSAVNLAIKQGKKTISNADMIQNADIKEKNIIIPLIYGYKCMLVEGEVVSSTSFATKSSR